MVKDVKVIANEECITQHRIVIATITLKPCSIKPRVYVPRIKTWKLHDTAVDTAVQEYLKCIVNEKYNKEPIFNSVEESWEFLKTSFLEGTETVCGKIKGGPTLHNETWWWKRDVDNAIKEKRKLWKQWKDRGSKTLYMEAKKRAKNVVCCKKGLPSSTF